MSKLKKFIILLTVAALNVSLLSAPALALQYEYVPGYGMMPVANSTSGITAVDNNGTFGMSVDDFRYMCMDTGGEWDVVSGRHVCYCEAGEFNYPFGCPEVIVIEDTYQQAPPVDQYYDPYYDDRYDDDYYYEDHDYYYDDYEDDYYYDDYDEDYYDDDRDYYYHRYDDVDFYDIAGHPDEYYIWQLYDLGILRGYPDGTFRPDQPVTRAEMAKMVLMASGIEPLECDEDRNMFFSDLDGWQAPWINAGYRLDILEGYSGYNSGVRLYKPNNYVNRAEGVKLVLASFGRRPLDFDRASFIDIEGWMVPWIEDAYRIGLIDDTYDRQFYPAMPMTRGMAARVIVRMLEYSGDI